MSIGATTAPTGAVTVVASTSPTANALTTLNLSGGSGNVVIENGNLESPTNITLNATVAGLKGGTLRDAGVYTTLNITTVGSDSTLANISASADIALTVAGTKLLTLTSTAGLPELGTVTVSGEAGLRADLSSTSTTAVDTSATTGTSTITVDGTKATFTGGAGVDRVTLTTGLTKAVSLGDGDDRLTIGALVPTAVVSGGPGVDTLSMDATNAATASGSAAFAESVTGFENLVLTGATNQTVSLSALEIPNAVSVSGGNVLTLNDMNSGGILTLTGAGTAYTVSNSAFTTGVNDTINLALTNASGFGTNVASTGITAANVEHIAFTNDDAQATPSGSFNNLVTLLGNTAKTITVAGNAGLTLTATDRAATLIDASGITLGGFTYNSGALNANAAIKGSATGLNTVDFSAAARAVTYSGGSGADSVTTSNSQNNVIDAGDGANSVSATGNGNQTITGGADADQIRVGNGNNTISTGSGAEVVVTATASIPSRLAAGLTPSRWAVDPISSAWAPTALARLTT